MSKKEDFSELEQWDFRGYDYEEIKLHLAEYTPLIGLFLVRFSYLEHELNLAIAGILNDQTDEIGYVVIKELTTSNKIQLFYKMYLKLASLRGDDAKKSLEEVKEHLVKINRLRNNIVHANWQTLDKDECVRIKIHVDTEEGFIKFEKIKITPKIIENEINEIYSLTSRIEEYKEDMLNFES